MHRKFLVELLQQYQSYDEIEESMRNRMLSFIEQHENCFDRELAVGHITGSAWIVSPDRDKALLLHHRKLDRWFQPGGHSDGDANTVNVALREASEESGISQEHIFLASQGIFDVDIHTIPGNKKEAQHDHFDVRFLLEIDDTLPLISNDESNEVKWIALGEIANYNSEASVSRMVKKTLELQHT